MHSCDNNNLTSPYLWQVDAGVKNVSGNESKEDAADDEEDGNPAG